jgi:arginyl-tRNA synthetase
MLTRRIPVSDSAFNDDTSPRAFRPLILGKDNRPFKTRSGGTVKLVDVLNEAEQRAAAIIEQKNPELPGDEKQRVARVIGIGAVKYADLANDRVRDYVFDWDRMLAFDGNTAPYLINAYVRIRSIFRKGEVDGGSLRQAAISVAETTERALVLKLLQLPVIVAGVAASLEPHRLCNYLYELAALYHQFYEQCPVLKAPDAATRDSRLRLSDLTARVLSRGLDLLGIAVVERM